MSNIFMNDNDFEIEMRESWIHYKNGTPKLEDSEPVMFDDYHTEKGFVYPEIDLPFNFREELVMYFNSAVIFGGGSLELYETREAALNKEGFKSHERKFKTLGEAKRDAGQYKKLVLIDCV